MFRLPLLEKVKRARQQRANITPLAVPFKGMNARSPFSVMSAEYGISLSNVVVEAFGLRTRKGYTEWARDIPGGSIPVSTVMNYLPASAPASTYATPPPTNISISGKFFAARRSTIASIPGKLFAAKGNLLYDVSTTGVGPWTAEVGVAGLSDFWTWTNFQNVAGSFLCVCNDEGGYKIYNGTTWATPTLGGGAGQIAGCDPALFCYVLAWKKRLWFIEKGTTRAWYLPVGQITGTVVAFDFGEQFKHGGALAALASWTMDSGDGMDDNLVAASYEGDIVVYQGVDPSSATDFLKKGSWYTGPLPIGRRMIVQDGGDVFILSQFGVMPLSKLVTASYIAEDDQQHMSYLVDPVITQLMQDFSNYNGWQVLPLSREELIVVGIPREAVAGNDTYLAYKTTTKSWSVLANTTYCSFASIGSIIYAGTKDGRVVRAFDGPLDNIIIGSTAGTPIVCQVTPAYQPMGEPGLQKIFSMVRPAFLTANIPVVRVSILVDYGGPRLFSIPTLPDFGGSLWDVALWDTGVWSGMLEPLREWFGCTGLGFAATVQIDYVAGGDTLLTSIDFLSEQGGVF